MTIGLEVDELLGLPEPAIIETLSFEEIVTRMRDKLVELFPEIENVIDLESEPARKLIETYGYSETLVRARVNDAIRANLLAYATGSDLDHLSAFYDLTRLTGETDDALRKRTVLAIQGRSTGGTAARYRLVALSADVRVRDAIAYIEDGSPLITVAVYSTDVGGVANAELLEIVDEAVQADTVRMVNDTIVVRSAVSSTVDITAGLWLTPGAPASTLDVAEQALRDKWDAIGGLDVNMTLSMITAALMVPGVQRVDISAPAADVIVPGYEAVALGTLTLTLAGRDL